MEVSFYTLAIWHAPINLPASAILLHPVHRPTFRGDLLGQLLFRKPIVTVPLIAGRWF